MKDRQIEETEEYEKTDRKKSAAREIADMLLYIGVIILISLLIVKYVGQRTLVDGNSMYDTLTDGDQLIVEKLSYHFSDPERFDVIVFHYNTEKNFIKRIIGLPGETVQIIDGTIYINGEVLEEDYGYEKMLKAGRAAEPITLGEDEYFVLGDNRNNSQDSRKENVGNINRSQIIGKAWCRIWPFNAICMVD